MSTLYRFHVNIRSASSSPALLTWEDVAALLERLPRMIFEPDGSFVLSGETAEPNERAGASPLPASQRWQVDGHLIDFSGTLHRMELHGQCPAAAFDEILASVGWPEQPLVFEMVREGVTLSESDFRRRVAVQSPTVDGTSQPEH